MKRTMNKFLVVVFMMVFFSSSIMVAKQCNDLIFAFDSNKDETVNNRSFFVGLALVNALYEKAAPIVVSTHTVSNLCSFYKIWQQRQEDLKSGVSGDIEQKYKNLLPAYGYDFALFNSIRLSDDDWHCYMHKSKNFMLFVPKKYITERVAPGISDINGQIEACGFKTTDLDKVDNISPESLLQYIESNKSTSSLNIVDSVKSIFITKKPADITELSAWNFYITGHGGSQKRALAGLKFDDFINLMTFFNTAINTNFVHYVTCYGGGQNQTLVNEELQKINVDYIVSAEGNNEVVVMSREHYKKDVDGKFVFTSDKFVRFFDLLEHFFGDQLNLGPNTSKQWRKDPIATIVDSVIDSHDRERNQPFVRIPSAGVFTVANVDKQVKILTHSVVKAYELEGQTIDCSDKAITTIFVYPKHIKVPLKKLKGQAIVSPNAQSVANFDKLHIFEKIESDGFVVSDFLRLNATLSKTTFIVKKFICQGMDPVENLIIMMRNGVLKGISVQGSVSVAFAIGNRSYEQMDIVVLGDVVPDKKMYRFDELSAYTAANSSRVFGSNASLINLINGFEKDINQDFEVQKPGALKKVLLLQQLQGLEVALTAQALSEQQEFLSRTNKPAGVFINSLNKKKADLDTLKKEFDQAFAAKQFDNTEYADIKNRINKINESLDIVLKGGQLPVEVVQPAKEIEQPVKPAAEPVRIEEELAKPVKPIEQSVQAVAKISAQQEKELRQAVIDYKKNKNRSKAEEVIKGYADTYPNDSVVKAKLSEKQKFDATNVHSVQQNAQLAEQPVKAALQPQVVAKISEIEEKELRQAVIDYKKNKNRTQAENIIKKYADKYPNDKLVSNKLSEKKKFDEENLKK